MPASMTATQALAALRAGTLTSERLVAACLARIADREPELQAWVEVNGHQALAQARACDRRSPDGLLHGLPIGVKDVLETRGFPTRCQSPIPDHSLAAVDAYCVAAARRAGAIILGKTMTSEFAFVTPAATRNPHQPAHTPGGSSSGSAAAVAAQMVPLALATQTGGSTIRPAAYCGIVGYKPTFGLINRAGLRPLAESLDTIGLMARCVDDVILLARVLAYRPLHPEPLARGGCRLAVCGGFLERYAESEAVACLRSVEAALEAAGAILVRVDLPAEFEQLTQDQTLVMEYEAARALLAQQCDYSGQLSPALRERLERGWRHPWSAYRQALDRAAWCRQHLASVLADADAILTFSACGPAPASLAHAGDSVMNRGWTLLGAPCLALPAGVSRLGLPLGVQLVAAAGQDERLLGVGRWAAGQLAASACFSKAP